MTICSTLVAALTLLKSFIQHDMWYGLSNSRATMSWRNWAQHLLVSTFPQFMHSTKAAFNLCYALEQYIISIFFLHMTNIKIPHYLHCDKFSELVWHPLTSFAYLYILCAWSTENIQSCSEYIDASLINNNYNSLMTKAELWAPAIHKQCNVAYSKKHQFLVANFICPIQQLQPEAKHTFNTFTWGLCNRYSMMANQQACWSH